MNLAEQKLIFIRDFKVPIALKFYAKIQKQKQANKQTLSINNFSLLVTSVPKPGQEFAYIKFAQEGLFLVI